MRQQSVSLFMVSRMIPHDFPAAVLTTGAQRVKFRFDTIQELTMPELQNFDTGTRNARITYVRQNLRSRERFIILKRPFPYFGLAHQACCPWATLNARPDPRTFTMLSLSKSTRSNFSLN